MTQLEQVYGDLKSTLKGMAMLVKSQLEKSKTALLQFDKSLANEVLHTEKRVNGMELQIDKLCEDIVALYNPVAVDMRMVFAYFKINSHLERMGDYAKNIALSVLVLEAPYSNGLLEKLDIEKMFEVANNMIDENIVALVSGNADPAHDVFEMDIEINSLHNKNIEIIVEEIKNNTVNTKALIELASIVRRLERVGDYNTNIAEELIFCIEALVLKHKEKNSTK